MTIERDVRIKFASNIFADNEIVVFDDVDFLERRLGAMECLSENSGDGNSALVNSIECAIHIIRERIASSDMFILIGDSTWQPDTRIIRHRGAMGRLKMRGIDFGVDPELVSLVEEDELGVRFFSLTKVSDKKISLLPSVMQSGSIAYLIVLVQGEKWRPSLEEGVSGDWRADSALVSTVTQHGGVVMRRVGFFDDPEVGVQGIADADVIEKLAGN